MELEFIEIINDHYGLSAFPDKPVEAMAYVPFQPHNAETYSPTQGFSCGTMFPSLNKPFYGGKCGGPID